MNVAFIPVRGGSKSIPLKNIKEICGKPLVYWTVKAACECEFIDRVYVATDNDHIQDTVILFGFEKVQVIGRSANTASDTASTELAMLEFAENNKFDNIVLIQATSPLLTANDLKHGFETFELDNTDSVLSVVRQKRFQWTINEKGFAHPTNYDVFARPRRQEFEGHLVENGAFYITSRENLIKYRNRVSGNIRVVEMREDTFFEIDELEDWLIVEVLMKKNGMNTEVFIPDIKLFLTDCDGCLTDGGMYYGENGDELKKFNTKDGMAFQLLKERGIITGIVTGENSELVRRRAEKLKLDVLEMGSIDKLGVINKICEQYGISIKNVAYIGDDINDVEAIRAVGFGCSVRNGVQEALDAAKYITKAKGGEGAIREVAVRIISHKIKK
jgi:YrbI family 3-deoxy-D-manno-octulosonate 8-phosphate phosphatase